LRAQLGPLQSSGRRGRGGTNRRRQDCADCPRRPAIGAIHPV